MERESEEDAMGVRGGAMATDIFDGSPDDVLSVTRRELRRAYKRGISYGRHSMSTTEPWEDESESFGYAVDERTCRVLLRDIEEVGDGEFISWYSLDCGHEYDTYYGESPRFCPVCGARVTGDEDER